MKNLICLFLITLSFVSCKKSYQYILVYEDISITGNVTIKEKEPEIIKAKHDSIAYLEAYNLFTISEFVHHETTKMHGRYFTKPIGFKLISPDKKDISKSTFFVTKDSEEEAIKTLVYSRKIFNSASSSSNNNTEPKIDSAVIKELVNHFHIEKDEFQNDEVYWYKPKSAPVYINKNGLYCYFQVTNGVPMNFRLRVQYHADDWLFFDRLTFSIDDVAYVFLPNTVERDNGSGGIWEWVDEEVTSSDIETIKALSIAKAAKVRFEGDQYKKIQQISASQIQSLRRTLDLYEAMGGSFE